VAVLVNSLIGTGIRPRAAGTDKAMNKLIDNLWARWTDQCDADGHTDFHGLLSLAMRETIEGGYVFALRVRRPRSAGLAVALRIELKEADPRGSCFRRELAARGAGRDKDQGSHPDQIQPPLSSQVRPQYLHVAPPDREPLRKAEGIQGYRSTLLQDRSQFQRIHRHHSNRHPTPAKANRP